jgi:predicted metalloendopeptidase
LIFKTYLVHTKVDQPHLGLPSRDYYLQERSRKDLEAYHAYMTQVTPLFFFQVIYIYTEHLTVCHTAINNLPY